MRVLLAGALALALSGCGAVYFTPSVSPGDHDDSKVRVRPMTVETALIANQSKYVPKQLPAVFFGTAGFATQPNVPVAAPPAPTDFEGRPAAIDRRLPPAVRTRPYDIGIGDVLLLATPQGSSSVEQLSGLLAAQNRRQGYTVQDDGAIAIPDVGRVLVAGLTLEAAEAELFQRLVAAQIDPTFSLEVAEFNSKRVSIGGAVGRPGVVPITLTPLTLTEALAQSGSVQAGDLDFAAIRIYRNGALYQVPVRDLYSGNVPQIILQNGDSVFVDTEYELGQAQSYFAEQIRLAEFRQRARSQALSELQSAISRRRADLTEARQNFQTRERLGAVERDYVYVVGEVENPRRSTLPFGRKATLADVLFNDGGLRSNGDPRNIYVMRGSQDPREFSAVDAWRLDVRNASNMLVATRFELRPNDVIFISPQPVTRWNRAISQITPQFINLGINTVRSGL